MGRTTESEIASVTVRVKPSTRTFLKTLAGQHDTTVDGAILELRRGYRAKK